MPVFIHVCRLRFCEGTTGVGADRCQVGQPVCLRPRIRQDRQSGDRCEVYRQGKAARAREYRTIFRMHRQDPNSKTSDYCFALALVEAKGYATGGVCSRKKLDVLPLIELFKKQPLSLRQLSDVNGLQIHRRLRSTLSAARPVHECTRGQASDHAGLAFNGFCLRLRWREGDGQS